MAQQIHPQSRPTGALFNVQGRPFVPGRGVQGGNLGQMSLISAGIIADRQQSLLQRSVDWSRHI